MFGIPRISKLDGVEECVAHLKPSINFEVLECHQYVLFVIVIFFNCFLTPVLCNCGEILIVYWKYKIFSEWSCLFLFEPSNKSGILLARTYLQLLRKESSVWFIQAL